MVKKILISVMLVFLAMQFVRPSRNESEGLSDADISLRYAIPGDVHQLFVDKCYDCHSNNTVYPWYYSVQPVAWWMAGHVDEGKEHLNFSEFKNYPEKRATHKLEEIMEMIAEDEMPLPSYLIAHPEAKVSPQEKESINSWIKSLGVVKASHEP
jgi:hypothetical protein